MNLKTLILTLATVAIAAKASAQDLFQDMVRLAPSRQGLTGTQHVIYDGTPGPQWLTGVVDFATQPIISQPLQELANTSQGTFDYDILTTINANSQFSGSALFWNFHQGAKALPDGTIAPGSSVVMDYDDVFPVVEIYIAPDTTKPITIHTAAASIGGTAPGSIVLETYSAGVWTTLFNENLSAARSDTRTITVSKGTRFRWILEAPGTNTAVCTLSVVMTR